MSRQQNGGIFKIRESLQALSRDHREITAIYLFGSTATGKAGPLSDVDVAVLLDESRLKPERGFGLQAALISDAMHACRRLDVDVVLLNYATPLLAYEVVREGKVLFERNRDARVAFEARAVGHYLDLKPFYQVQRSYLKRQLLRKGRGG